MITVGFIALLMANLAFWQRGIRETLQNKTRTAARKQTINFWLLAGGWLAYITILSNTGVLTNMASPLRIPALVVLPVVAFIVYFFVSPTFKNLIRRFPRQMPVYGQTMRIAIELLIYGSYVQGVIPAHATFEGYNLSILVGLSAPVVGCLAFLSKSMSSRMLVAWNLAGLALAAAEMFIFVSVLLSPELCGADRAFAPAIGQMPYLLLLAVFIPSSAIMHLVSIIQTLTLAKRRAMRQFAC